MTAIAHFIAISLYLGAAALAAAPFARPVPAPVTGVTRVLALGVLAHAVALLAATHELGHFPITGLGPALSFAGFVLAVTLLVVECLAREVSLTLAAAPLVALCTVTANLIGMQTLAPIDGAQGAWLTSHIALSFAGIAAYATAAAAGAVYLAEHRELRSRRFGVLFRFFPPLETLDRVNHLASLGGWLGLTLGVALAFAYSAAYGFGDLPQLIWGTAAWLGITTLAVGRVLGGWRARRAALVASLTFAAVVALYVVARLTVSGPGRFL